ncbi:hypothetical protein ACFWF7_38640 [Nocardia sp. NPDC060256]|uniref:hypothetical protein n=1 Tax=unclassified Nocardia TaxID=2637762 RepID=UPI00366A335E
MARSGYGALNSEVLSGRVMKVVDCPEHGTTPSEVILLPACDVTLGKPDKVACNGVQVMCSLDDVVASEQHHTLERAIACPDRLRQFCAEPVLSLTDQAAPFYTVSI